MDTRDRLKRTDDMLDNFFNKMMVMSSRDEE